MQRLMHPEKIPQSPNPATKKSGIEIPCGAEAPITARSPQKTAIPKAL